MEPNVLTGDYVLESFYPKTHNFVTNEFMGQKIRLHDQEDQSHDTIIDDYVGNLRKVAKRSRGNTRPTAEGDPYAYAEVNYFRISRAIDILKYVESFACPTDCSSSTRKKLLDMSAGWGDRLLASIHLNYDYTGTDPSENMEPVYKRMIYDNGADEYARVYTVPFEDFEVTENTYDIAFTSPPYYDVEIYNNEPTQSINRYPNYTDWMVNFLLPCLKKIIFGLKPYGRFILHLGDTKSVHLAEPALFYLLSMVPDVVYNGVFGIGYAHYRPVWVFQKVPGAIPEPNYFSCYYPVLAGNKYDVPDLNPNVSTRKIGQYLLIDDSVLPGGTKQRAIMDLLSHNWNAKTFYYAGPITGMACVAISYACSLVGKKCHLFLQGYHNNHRKIIGNYGGVIDKFTGSMKDLREKIDSVVTNTDYVLPFGMDNVIFIEGLISALRQATASVIQPKRCWLVAGSGVLLRALAAVWPSTQFHVVQVGRSIYYDTFSDDILDRCVFYTSQTPFSKPTRAKVPYDTILEYDGKVWEFIPSNAQPGDYIWNVGK